MESVFITGYVPHISEKILMCMNFDSILACRSLNHKLKIFFENILVTNPKLFRKNLNSTGSKHSTVALDSLDKLWKTLVQLIDLNDLWNKDLYESVVLCLIHVFKIRHHNTMATLWPHYGPLWTRQIFAQ